MTDRVRKIIESAVDAGISPGIAFALSTSHQETEYWYAGKVSHAVPSKAVDGHTVFDLASLTKPLCTTLWCLNLVDSGALHLEDPISKHLDVSDPQLAKAPIWRLMNHSSGLTAHHRFYDVIGAQVLKEQNFDTGREFIRRSVRESVLEMAPGEAEVYSDIGYLALEMVCESRSSRLDEGWCDFRGHGEDSLHFNKQNTTITDPAHYAATELCPWRKELLIGRVHDDNCWTMGGVAGHAGLFGSLRSVHEAALSWLGASNGHGAQLGVAGELVVDCLDRRWMHPEGSRVLGWDTPSPGGSTSGTYFGPRSFGHLGFTGTSIWIDPDAEIVMTLLTNRVCPSRDNWGIRQLRPQLHDAAWQYARRTRKS